jgi:hypothetical protein
MRRLATWAVVLLVVAVAVVAIVAAIVNNDSPSTASAGATTFTTQVSLCDSTQLELSIRASGFAAHVAALRLAATQPCNVGQLHVTASVLDRNGRSVTTTVAPPQEFTGQIHPGDEMIATFDYRAECRQQGPFSATVIAEGEIGSVTATAPVSFRRDPFKQSACPDSTETTLAPDFNHISAADAARFDEASGRLQGELDAIVACIREDDSGCVNGERDRFRAAFRDSVHNLTGPETRDNPCYRRLEDYDTVLSELRTLGWIFVATEPGQPVRQSLSNFWGEATRLQEKHRDVPARFLAACA